MPTDAMPAASWLIMCCAIVGVVRAVDDLSDAKAAAAAAEASVAVV